jgi:hypothetical protein
MTALKGRGHGAKDDAIRERAVLALLSERSIGAAAKRCGIREKTLRRWMTEDAAFQAELGAARTAMFQAGMGRIQALTVRAVDTLDELLDAKKHPGVRLGAARTVAELGVHQHDAETIMRKLEEIEAQQRKQQQRR